MEKIIMEILECNTPNENIEFLKNILGNLVEDASNLKWAISDMELIPVFHGDYSGVGAAQNEGKATLIQRELDQKTTIWVDTDQLNEILSDTQAIRDGVIICFEKSEEINDFSFCPMVHSEHPDHLYDKRAKFEIRVLEHSLFIILRGNNQ